MTDETTKAPPSIVGAESIEILHLATENERLRQENEGLRQALDLTTKGHAKIPGYPLGKGAFLIDESTVKEWRRELEKVLDWFNYKKPVYAADTAQRSLEAVLRKLPNPEGR